MSDTLRGNCTITSAALTLVDEALLTRAALSPEQAEEKGPTTTLGAGDPRLQALTAALDGIDPVAVALPSVDARTVIRLSCADGQERIIVGSKSAPEGMFIKVAGKGYRVPPTLRSALEALAR